MQQGVQERVSTRNRGCRRGSVQGIGGGGEDQRKQQGVWKRASRRNKGCRRGGPAEATICRNMQSLPATTLVAARSGGSATAQLM